jgi:hypothetical protein
MLEKDLQRVKQERRPVKQEEGPGLRSDSRLETRELSNTRNRLVREVLMLKAISLLRQTGKTHPKAAKWEAELERLVEEGSSEVGGIDR